MSATKGGNGEWLIDPAELFRVYQPVATDSPKSALAHTTETAGLTAGLAVEREKREALEREREREREQLESQIADLKQDRDFWRQQATALLADHRLEPQPVPPPRRGLRGWLHRITA